MNYYIELLLLSLVISFAALGFRVITDKGMLLYILRKPFDDLSARKKECLSRIKYFDQLMENLKKDVMEREGSFSFSTMTKVEKGLYNTYDSMKKTDVPKPNKYDWILYLGKPVLLCSSCMASVHTLIWFPLFNEGFAWEIIPVMLVVVFMNSIMYLKYESLKR